jgi:hypothetical protein
MVRRFYPSSWDIRGEQSKQKLLGIGKRGNQYLKTLLMQGARAVLQFKEKQSSGLRNWLVPLTARTHYNVAGVVLANKLARIAWAVLTTRERYRPPVLPLASEGVCPGCSANVSLRNHLALSSFSRPRPRSHGSVLARSAREQREDTTVEPALWEPESGKSPTRLLTEMGIERSAFHAGPEDFPPTKAVYIRVDHMVISFFA